MFSVWLDQQRLPYSGHSSGQYTPVSPVQGVVPTLSPHRGSASSASCRPFFSWRFAAAAWLPRGAILRK